MKKKVGKPARKKDLCTRVYLLVEEGHDDGDAVIGVYSTQKKADHALDHRPCEETNLHIEDFVLDAKPEYSSCIGHD